MERQVAQFVNYIKVERGLSPNTVDAYRRDLMKLTGFCQKRKLKVSGVGRAQVVDLPIGDGHLVTFAIRPFWPDWILAPR